MNPFWQLLNRINPWALFLLLMLISIFMIVRTNEAQGEIFWNSTGIVTGAFSDGANVIRDYLNLRRENDNLKNEISVLRSQMAQNQYNKEVVRDTMQKVVDSNLVQIYQFITARVVNNSVDKPKNYLMLDRGRNQGVNKNMGVITNDGILGVVRYVSANYCIVMSILHTDTRVSAQIRNKGIYGSLIWPGKSPRYMELNDIPKHNKISVREDYVETTGFSTYYPPGITIGKVFYHEVLPGSSNHVIKVELSTNMAKVRYAQIVVHKYATEIRDLEKARQKDEQ